MKYLRLISCIIVFYVYSGALVAQPHSPSLCNPNDSIGFYKVNLEFSRNTLSGLLILKATNDSTLRLILNADMGPKLLDMEISPSGYKIIYAFRKLNKKMIFKTFHEDFGALSGIIIRNKSFVADTGQLAVLYTYNGGKKKKFIYSVDLSTNKYTSGRIEERKSIKTIFYYFYEPTTSEINSMKLEHQHFKMAITLNRISL